MDWFSFVLGMWASLFLGVVVNLVARTFEKEMK